MARTVVAAALSAVVVGVTAVAAAADEGVLGASDVSGVAAAVEPVAAPVAEAVGAVVEPVVEPVAEAAPVVVEPVVEVVPASEVAPAVAEETPAGPGGVSESVKPVEHAVEPATGAVATVAVVVEPVVEVSGSAAGAVGGQVSGLAESAAGLAQPVRDAAPAVGRSLEVPAGILESLLALLQPAGGEGGPLLVSQFFPVVSSGSVTFGASLAAGSPMVAAGFSPPVVSGQSGLVPAAADASWELSSPGLSVAFSAASGPLTVDPGAVVNPRGASGLSVEADAAVWAVGRFSAVVGVGVGSAAAWSASAVAGGVVAALLGLLVFGVPGVGRRLRPLPGFLRPSVVVSLSGRPG